MENHRGKIGKTLLKGQCYPSAPDADLGRPASILRLPSACCKLPPATTRDFILNTLYSFPFSFFLILATFW